MALKFIGKCIALLCTASVCVFVVVFIVFTALVYYTHHSRRWRDATIMLEREVKEARKQRDIELRKNALTP